MSWKDAVQKEVVSLDTSGDRQVMSVCSCPTHSAQWGQPEFIPHLGGPSELGTPCVTMSYDFIFLRKGSFYVKFQIIEFELKIKSGY